MPRTSNLRFNQEQEAKLAQYLSMRRTSLVQDNAARIDIDREAWNRYNLDVTRRLPGMAGPIWPLSNLPIPVFPMVCEHFVSRCEDATVGDEPFFHFEAVGISAEDKRLTYDRYFNWKLDQGGVHDALLESNLPTFIQKAHIQKAAYTKQIASWVDMDVNVLHDKRTGQPIEIPDHGPIIQGEDQFIDQVDPIAPAVVPPEAPETVTQDPAQATSESATTAPAPTRKHLVADPTFVLDPTQHEWKAPAQGIKRTQMLYCGPKSELVRFDQFFLPMDAASVEAADVALELQDQPYHWFKDMWLDGRPWATWDKYEPSLRTGDTTAKTGHTGESADSSKPVEPRSFDNVNPVRRIALFWVRRDVLTDGRGTPQEFAVWMDIDLEVLIYYEWQAKLTPDMKRPYTVTSLTREPNRWCGKSIWERGRHLFEAIDRQFNGEYYRTIQQANPPKGGDPTAAKEEPDDVGPDPLKYWEMKPGKTIDDLLQYAKVPDTNQRTQQVLEFIIFWIQLWLGVSNIAQGDYAAVPDNSTKYGIQKTLQEASMLGRRWIRRKLNADEEHLTKLVKIAIATIPQNQEETFEFVDGDVRQMAIITGAEIKTLNIHVKIIESQHHEEQDIERCNSALAVQERFFAQLNPDVRRAMRPLLVEILSDLGFKNGDELLPEFTAVPMTEAMMGGNPAQTGAVQEGAVPDAQKPEAAKAEAANA